jgi:hypothetical protein
VFGNLRDLEIRRLREKHYEQKQFRNKFGGEVHFNYYPPFSFSLSFLLYKLLYTPIQARVWGYQCS